MINVNKKQMMKGINKGYILLINILNKIMNRNNKLMKINYNKR